MKARTSFLALPLVAKGLPVLFRGFLVSSNCPTAETSNMGKMYLFSLLCSLVFLVFLTVNAFGAPVKNTNANHEIHQGYDSEAYEGTLKGNDMPKIARSRSSRNGSLLAARDPTYKDFATVCFQHTHSICQLELPYVCSVDAC